MSAQSLKCRVEHLEQEMTGWMALHAVTLLRLSLGVVFFWFGALKLVPGLSPAEGLLHATLSQFVPLNVFQPFLAVWEMAIGLGFITGRFMRLTLLLLFLQMPGTFSPLLLRPDLVWTEYPFGLSMAGQYIVKNLVLLSAGLVLGATVRGGGLVDEPSARQGARNGPLLRTLGREPLTTARPSVGSGRG